MFCIDNSTKKLLYRLRMIEEAQSEIILSSFAFNSDKVGRDILSTLIDTADRSVSVRIIVDGISEFLNLRGDTWFQATVSHPNIEICVYNPVNFLSSENFRRTCMTNI